MKISIIITSYKEPKTIGRAISAFLRQNPRNYELIVTAPDKDTLDVAKRYANGNKNVKVIKDEGRGKPAALNRVFKLAKGEILILSDGDVYVSPDSISQLEKHFINPKVGGVSARVVSANPKDEMFGFWAFILTEGFHNKRMVGKNRRANIDCTGYLYAIRSGVIKAIPEEVLADDALISLMINKAGFRTVYEPKAKVYVKYATSLKDWIRQKKRTAGKFYQLAKYFPITKASSFQREVIAGFKTMKHLTSLKRIFWFELLAIMKLYIWFRVFFDFRLWKRSLKETWQRVESTK